MTEETTAKIIPLLPATSTKIGSPIKAELPRETE